MAQNVYSLNVVGYINITLQAGYNAVANQLDLDGTGTNNTLTSVFGTQLPSHSSVYGWTGVTFTKATFNGTTWGGDTATATAGLQPSYGVLVSIPAASVPLTVTLVGNVMQGTNTIPLAGGVNNLVSFKAPITGKLGTDLGYMPTSHDVYLPWSLTAQAWTPKQSYNGTTWSAPGEPVLSIATPFFLNPHNTTNWTQAFTVQ